MTQDDYHEIALAFRNRRAFHSDRANITCTGSILSYKGHIVAERHAHLGIRCLLFGRPHEALPILNAICELYHAGRPYRVDADNCFYFNNREISTLTAQYIIGPIGMLAVERANRKENTE